MLFYKDSSSYVWFAYINNECTIYIYKRWLFWGLTSAIGYLDWRYVLSFTITLLWKLLTQLHPHNLDNLLEDEIQHNDILFCCISKPNFFQWSELLYSQTFNNNQLFDCKNFVWLCVVPTCLGPRYYTFFNYLLHSTRFFKFWVDFNNSTLINWYKAWMEITLA